jgi:hypothetical protein
MLHAVPLGEPWTLERARRWWHVHCPPRRGSGAVAQSDAPLVRPMQSEQ